MASCTIATVRPADSNRDETSGGAESGGGSSGGHDQAGSAGKRPSGSAKGGGGSTGEIADAGAAGEEPLTTGGTVAVVIGNEPIGSFQPLGAAGDGDGGDASSDTNCQGANGEPGFRMLATVRDFKMDKVDFESDTTGSEPGIVKRELGPDRKPVFSGIASKTVSGAASFDQWYRDVPGVNIPFLFEFALEQRDGHYVGFSRSQYFPLDDLGFGNEGNPHNYHFTTEIHAEFQFNGGEAFTFSGDDDVWVFVNDTLVIDLGGTHGPLSQTVEMNAIAQQLGMKIGRTYPIDFFHAERHTVDSNFEWQTNLSFTHCMF